MSRAERVGYGGWSRLCFRNATTLANICVMAADHTPAEMNTPDFSKYGWMWMENEENTRIGNRMKPNTSSLPNAPDQGWHA